MGRGASRGAATLRPYRQRSLWMGRGASRGAAVLRPYDGGAQQRCARTGSGVCGWGAARVGAQQCCARTMAGRSSAAPVRWRGAVRLHPRQQRRQWRGCGKRREELYLRTRER